MLAVGVHKRGIFAAAVQRCSDAALTLLVATIHLLIFGWLAHELGQEPDSEGVTSFAVNAGSADEDGQGSRAMNSAQPKNSCFLLLLQPARKQC